MIKKVFRPFWSYDVIKTEEWLSFMAESGYILVKINRVTRCFFFEETEPQKLVYRIVFDKLQSDSLSKGLLDYGWRKVFQSGKWYVTVNEETFQQIKTFPVREGIIKHNRLIMYFFVGLLFYLSFTALFPLTISLAVIFSGGKVEVVDSPLWVLTYLYFAVEAMVWILCIYSVIKIYKTNKKLLHEGLRGKVPQVERMNREEEKKLKQAGQLVVKRKLGWMYSPDKLEKWLEAIEEQGYNLYRVGKNGTTFYFTIGRPRKVSYCVDYQNFADESYFAFHRDGGWENVYHSKAALQKWTIWSREYTNEEERPQIYSDKTNHLKYARNYFLFQ